MKVNIKVIFYLKPILTADFIEQIRDFIECNSLSEYMISDKIDNEEHFVIHTCTNNSWMINFRDVPPKEIKELCEEMEKYKREYNYDTNIIISDFKE